MVNSHFDHLLLATKFASMLQDTCHYMCATDDSFVSVQTVYFNNLFPFPVIEFCSNLRHNMCDEIRDSFFSRDMRNLL